ncbi:MAG: GTP-binding protein HSR1, partial [Sedimenticolaceae bacterium]
GVVAYYSTYVVGHAAERYLANGKSWGDAGPKLVVREILDSLDRDSIMDQAKADIRNRLKVG